MSKFQDYMNGLCTDVEYMSSEYNGYIGNVVINNHSYYVFGEKRNDVYDYYIRDFENGVRSGFVSQSAMNENDVFEYIYVNDQDFKDYVNTAGECLESL